MSRRDPRLLEMVDEIRELVDSGEVQGLFVVMGFATTRRDPIPEYDCVYRAADVGDLLMEARHQVTRARSRREPTVN